MYATKLLKKNL